ATQPEIVTFAWIDNAFMQFPLNFYATKGSTYTSYEGEREWPTDGRKHKHPIQEAAEAEWRLISRATENSTSFSSFDFGRQTSRRFPSSGQLWNRPPRNTALCLSAVRANMTVAFRSGTLRLFGAALCAGILF